MPAVQAPEDLDPKTKATARGAMRPWVRELAGLALFAALSVYTTRPLAFTLQTHTLPGPDTALYVWIVNWVSGHLLSPGEIFEGNIFHPVRHAVLLSDLAFGTSLLVAPVRLFVRDPVPLYNIGVLLTLTFGAWAFYRLAYSLSGSRAAGLLTGCLAAYGSHQLLHVNQLAMVNIGFLGLFFLGLHRLFERPRSLWTILMTGVAFALNALSSGYFAIAATLLALVFALVKWRLLRRSEVWLACVAAAGVAAVALLPYILSFAELQETEGVARSIDFAFDQNFQPGRDLTSATYLYRRWWGSRGERLFPGVACLVLAAVACVRRSRGWAFYAASVPVMLCLSLGPELDVGGARVTLPYAWLFPHRPFNAMMHPHTFAAVARLSLCVLAGLGLATLLRRERRWAAPASIAVALAEIAAPPLVVRPVPPGVPAVYRALETLPPGSVLEIPPECPDALIWAARHGRPVVNGVGGMVPPAHALLQRWIANEWMKLTFRGHAPDVDRTRAMRQLLHMSVDYVIVPVARDPVQLPIQRAFESSRLFTRVAGEPGADTLYRRTAGAETRPE